MRSVEKDISRHAGLETSIGRRGTRWEDRAGNVMKNAETYWTFLRRRRASLLASWLRIRHVIQYRPCLFGAVIRHHTTTFSHHVRPCLTESTRRTEPGRCRHLPRLGLSCPCLRRAKAKPSTQPTRPLPLSQTDMGGPPASRSVGPPRASGARREPAPERIELAGTTVRRRASAPL